MNFVPVYVYNYNHSTRQWYACTTQWSSQSYIANTGYFHYMFIDTIGWESSLCGISGEWMALNKPLKWSISLDNSQFPHPTQKTLLAKTTKHQCHGEVVIKWPRKSSCEIRRKATSYLSAQEMVLQMMLVVSVTQLPIHSPAQSDVFWH